MICVFVLGLLTACSSDAPVTVDGVQVSAALRRLADEADFDYTGNLAKALKGDQTALQELFQFASDSNAAQDEHGAILRSVLSRVGDSSFAEALDRQPEEIKTAVWASLETKAPESLQSLAPATHEALLPSSTPEEHRGLYVFDEKMSTFRDCAEPEKQYVAVDETGGIGRNYRRLLHFPYPKQPIFAELKGYVAPNYKNLVKPANFAGFFVVTEILHLEAKNYRNTCIPYEYWAIGTEPFWYAQISKMEGIVEFRRMEDEGAKVFSYSAPALEADSSLVYSVINQDTGDNVRISIQKEKCGDGMSDIQYDYSVKMTMNGREYSGCGIRYGEAKTE